MLTSGWLLCLRAFQHRTEEKIENMRTDFQLIPGPLYLFDNLSQQCNIAQRQHIADIADMYVTAVMNRGNDLIHVPSPLDPQVSYQSYSIYHWPDYNK